MYRNSSTIIMASAITALILTTSVLVFTLTNQAFALISHTGFASSTSCPLNCSPSPLGIGCFCYGTTLSSQLEGSITHSLQPGQFIDRFGPVLTQPFQHDHVVLGAPELGLSAGSGATSDLSPCLIPCGNGACCAGPTIGSSR